MIHQTQGFVRPVEARYVVGDVAFIRVDDHGKLSPAVEIALTEYDLEMLLQEIATRRAIDAAIPPVGVLPELELIDTNTEAAPCFEIGGES